MAPTTSKMDRPALIDIRYSTLCSAVHSESRLFVSANFQKATPTTGSSTWPSRRVTTGIDGENEVTLRKSCAGIDRRTTAATGAVTDHHVDKTECTRPFGNAAGLIGRAVIHDNDLHRLQGLPAQRCDRRLEAGPTVEGGDDDTDRGMLGRRTGT